MKIRHYIYLIIIFLELIFLGGPILNIDISITSNPVIVNKNIISLSEYFIFYFIMIFAFVRFALSLYVILAKKNGVFIGLLIIPTVFFMILLLLSKIFYVYILDLNKEIVSYGWSIYIICSLCVLEAATSMYICNKNDEIAIKYSNPNNPQWLIMFNSLFVTDIKMNDDIISLKEKLLRINIDSLCENSLDIKLTPTIITNFMNLQQEIENIEDKNAVINKCMIFTIKNII